MNEDDAHKNILQPLIPDNHFFNPRFMDIISGKDYKEFCPLVPRFWFKDLGKEKKKKNLNSILMI